MPDAVFEHPRLAAIYDPLDPDRSDLRRLRRHRRRVRCAPRARHRLRHRDVRAAARRRAGIDVVGLEPALASLDVARAKPGADRVRWIARRRSRAPAADRRPRDDDGERRTGDRRADGLGRDARRCVTRARARRPAGVRDPRPGDAAAWQEWTREHTYSTTDVPGVGEVTPWSDVVEVALPLVTFRWTYGSRPTVPSTSPIRRCASANATRSPADLERHGFVVDEVRDAPDRPGREYVFVARRP